MKPFSRLIFIFTVALITFPLLYKCANKVPPSGGPSDTIPPTIIYSNPKNQSINVHSRVYEFTFDEKIKLQNLNRTMIITPRIDFDYEVKAGKKSFILVFAEDFKDNTTYTFNFRDAVQDVTEGNPLEDNIFTFSTGHYLDSLSVEGYAFRSLTKDTLKEATVGLYIVGDTTTILNGAPYYFTQTDEKGYYKLNNIKNGRYNIYGFIDANSNLTLETKSEAYAFIEDTLDIQQNIDSLNLYFVQHDVRDFNILSALPSGKNFDINFNKYITEFSVEPLYDNVRLYANRVKESKSIRIYNTFINLDSTAILVSATDSTYNNLEDTVWIKFNESKRKPDPITFKLAPNNGESITENFTADIVFDKPIAWIDSDSILFRVDTIVVQTITSRDQILANKHLTKFRLKFKLNKPYIDSLTILLDSLKVQQQAEDQEDTLQIESQQPQPESEIAEPRRGEKRTISQASEERKVTFQGLHLYLGKTSFISVENDSLPPTAINYQFLDRKMVGTVSGKINSEENVILQLLDESNQVIKESYSKPKFKFHNIKPGNYKLRMLIDINKNGVWDYGNLLKGQAPEPVKYYRSDDGTTSISVRANWEITDLTLEY